MAMLQAPADLAEEPMRPKQRHLAKDDREGVQAHRGPVQLQPPLHVEGGGWPSRVRQGGGRESAQNLQEGNSGRHKVLRQTGSCSKSLNFFMHTQVDRWNA